MMSLHKIPVIWVLVADAHTARIFKRHGDGLEYIAGMKPTFHYKSPANDQAHDGKAEAGFAHEIALWLDHAVRDGDYDRLVMIAAPRMLGDLRKCLSERVQNRVVAEVDKDLTKMPEAELKSELAKVVWF